MKEFSSFITEGKVIKQSPNPFEARSLLTQSKARLEDLNRLPLDEKSASFRFESAYESIREALQAFLAVEGYKPYSHEAIFSFALETRILPERDLMRADRYREIRNDINYRGKTVTIDEAKEIIHFAERVVAYLEEKFSQKT